MKISGLEKLTLTDFPGHLAAILFLEGCNFRCPFCQNSSLVLPHRESESLSPQHMTNPDIPLDSVLAFLKKRSGLLDGVCISGGEPTLHHDLPELIRQIRDLGYLVKLDTNGTNPEMLQALLEADLLDYVAMDIKAGRNHYGAVAGLSLSQEMFHTSSGSEHDEESKIEQTLSAVQKSVNLLMNSSVIYEFRTTVVKGLHKEEDFIDISDWIKGCPRYFLQSFRDCDSVLMKNHCFSAFSEIEMHHFLDLVKKNIPGAAIRGDEE